MDEEERQRALEEQAEYERQLAEDLQREMEDTK